MSVLIKELKMPDCCWNCPCIDNEYGECNISKKIIRSDKGRLADRPLIELPDPVPVIRCKDCKWWDKVEGSPYGYCMAMKHGYMSANWEIGIYRRYKGDFYCADAERSEDEHTD